MLRGRAIALALCAALLSGCGDVGEGASPAGEPSVPGTPTAAPSSPERDAAEQIAYGLVLRPGADGRTPVRVRWLQPLAAPETFAVDRHRIYVFDETARAFRLRDGALAWETELPGRNGLHADGGVVIGRDGPGVVRMWAPWNDDVSVDQRSGRLLSRRYPAGGDVPTSLDPFPAPSPRQLRVETWDPSEVVARTRQGRVAWRITVDEPWFQASPAVAVPGGLVLMTSSGHLVVLDHESAGWVLTPIRTYVRMVPALHGGVRSARSRS